MHMHLRAILTIALFTLREAIQNRLISLVLAALISLFGLAEFIGEVAITESAETKVSILSSALRFFAVLLISLFVTMSMLREQHEKSLDPCCPCRSQEQATSSVGFSVSPAPR